MIEVRSGCDIARVEADAIVNAANSSLLGGGGVDGAIHRAAGPHLLEATRRLGGCPPGEARLTPGFDLPARWVIHTVGPVWHGGKRGEKDVLARAYTSAFELAIRQGIRSIAFPAISTGAYRFPRTQAAVVALEVMGRYEALFERIIACCHSQADADVYLAVLADSAPD